MAAPLIIRLPRPTYLVVLALMIGVAPIGLYGGEDHPLQATVSALTLLYLIPVLAAFYIARTATIVSGEAITVRALFGRTRLPWDQVRGLSVTGRNIYAVAQDGGALRLPCVRLADLHAVAEASDGRLPELPAAVLKPAPSAHRR
ncbi:MAG: PH domain-containing protein [Actinobacteria bacterium]|nr:PH domain-containing protein [Actinomycetota bacterium]